MTNFRMRAPIFVALLAPVLAIVEFSQDVTNNVIFGSGNANGFFTTNRQNGIEIGIRAKRPFVGQTGSFDNGDGSYGPFMPGCDPNRNGRATWNFDWSVNSDFECDSGVSGCRNINEFTYEFSVDTDPTLGTDFFVYNPVNVGNPCLFVPDNEFGDNLSINGAGVTTTDCTTYNSLLADNNLMQNSVNYAFLESFFLSAGKTFNKDNKGIYDISIAAKDIGGSIVAKAEIRVLVGVELPTFTDECKNNGWSMYLVDTGTCAGGCPYVEDTCANLDRVPIFENQDECIQFVSGAGDPSAQGDPHFKTWSGQHYDFHGECDLVLLQSKEFESGLGLDIHIRTKIRRDMSYISSAALRIGSDVLEVESQGVYYVNGVLSAALPAEFGGFAFSRTQPTDKQHVFEVYLGGRERIKLKTYKDLVSVLIEQGQHKHFGDSAGLMGDFRLGHMVARDGKAVINDANAFGQEWQVLDTEARLFHTVRLPQHPQQVCTLPPPMQASQLRRRLSESSSIDQLAAEKACEHWGEGKDDCVFDVLTTGDLEMAVVGAY